MQSHHQWIYLPLTIVTPSVCRKTGHEQCGLRAVEGLICCWSATLMMTWHCFFLITSHALVVSKDKKPARPDERCLSNTFWSQDGSIAVFRTILLYNFSCRLTKIFCSLWETLTRRFLLNGTLKWSPVSWFLCSSDLQSISWGGCLINLHASAFWRHLNNTCYQIFPFSPARVLHDSQTEAQTSELFIILIGVCNIVIKLIEDGSSELH